MSMNAQRLYPGMRDGNLEIFHIEEEDKLMAIKNSEIKDFEDLDSLREALIDIDQVYHCAAIVSFNPQDDKAMNKTNVDGTRNLLYAVENSTVEKFLFVSSIAVLDGYNEQGMMDENSDFNPKLNHSGYAISKHLSEMEVWRASAEGLNTVIINPGLIIGSGNWKKSSGDLIS